MSTTQPDAWSATNYAANAHFVPALGNLILGMLDPQPTERILDLGCGDGVLTKKLQNLCAHVTGVDASSNMVATAKQDRGLNDVHVADGMELGEWFEKTGKEPYDAVFSNAALHWMKRDPLKVIEGVRKCLKPGGRFVGEMGGYLNVADLHGALISALNRRGYDGVAASPWFFPSPQHYQSLLEQGGFTVKHISLNPRPTELPTDLSGWLDTFSFQFLNVLASDEEKEAVKNEVVQQLTPTNVKEDGTWTVMYVRLRFVAVLES